VVAEPSFDNVVFLTIFSAVTHSVCLLFVHFLTARRHRYQIVKNLSFRVCPVFCLTRYHQVTVHTKERKEDTHQMMGFA